MPTGRLHQATKAGNKNLIAAKTGFVGKPVRLVGILQENERSAAVLNDEATERPV